MGYSCDTDELIGIFPWTNEERPWDWAPPVCNMWRTWKGTAYAFPPALVALALVFPLLLLLTITTTFVHVVRVRACVCIPNGRHQALLVVVDHGTASPSVARLSLSLSHWR